MHIYVAPSALIGITNDVSKQKKLRSQMGWRLDLAKKIVQFILVRHYTKTVELIKNASFSIIVLLLDIQLRI